MRTAWLLAIALGAGCSSSGGATPVVALYDGTARIDPYPSDHFTRADPSTKTGLRVQLDAAAVGDSWVKAYPGMLADLQLLDGFSTAGGVFVRFTEEIDGAALVARAPEDYASRGTPIALVDVDAASAVPLVARYFSSNDDPNTSSPDFTLVVEPAVPLEPRRRYLFVLSDAVRAASGAPVRASAATRALVAGDAEGAYGAALRAALPVVARAVDIGPERVALATLFTTGSVRDDIIDVASEARRAAPTASGAPVLQRRPPNDAGADRRVRFVGTFGAPEYRAPDGRWRTNGAKPEVQSTAGLEYFLAFSDATRSGPRPIVVFAHGLGGDKDGTWDVAQALAPLDVAVVGIDAPEHGSRHAPRYPPGQTDMVVSTLSFLGVSLEARSIDVVRARDNFRQMASDQLALFRFVSTLGALDVLPPGAPDGVPDLDPTRVLYIGVSFGAVLGATALSLAPEARAGCLTVGGGHLASIMRDSPTFRLLMRSLEPPDATDAGRARFMVMAQGLVDPGDPVNYAPFVAGRALDGVPGWRGTDILLQEVKDDNIIPNDATAALARSLGLAQVAPVVTPVAGIPGALSPVTANGARGATVGLVQFAETGGRAAEHGTLFDSTEARGQYVDFFRSALGAPRATITTSP
jgi:hypothetical protein